MNASGTISTIPSANILSILSGEKEEGASSIGGEQKEVNNYFITFLKC